MPDRIDTCFIAHFDGYVVEPRSIKDDSELKEEVETWIKNHPEYYIHHIEYNNPDSGGYEMSVDVYYDEAVCGRDYIVTKHGDTEKLFVLRNLATGHTVSLRRFDKPHGLTSFTLKDKEGSYVIEKKLEEGLRAGKFYTQCCYCGKIVNRLKEIRIGVKAVAHKRCVPRGLTIKRRCVVG